MHILRTYQVLKHKFRFLTYSNMAGFYDAFNNSLINFIRDFVSAQKHRRNGQIFFKLAVQVYLGVPLISLLLFLFVLSYLIKYAHNDLISDFSIFGIHSVIF